jgi:hypothetical protein
MSDVRREPNDARRFAPSKKLLSGAAITTCCSCSPITTPWPCAQLIHAAHVGSCDSVWGWPTWKWDFNRVLVIQQGFQHAP